MNDIIEYVESPKNRISITRCCMACDDDGDCMDENCGCHDLGLPILNRMYINVNE